MTGLRHIHLLSNTQDRLRPALLLSLLEGHPHTAFSQKDNMFSPTEHPSRLEFVILMAFMVSVFAMSTDVMLPAMSLIAVDLGIADANNVQLVVSTMFAGFAIGQLFAGPLSDSFGRKPVIYFGYFLFIFGCIISVLASDLSTMLAGRFLQGLGVAAPRTVTTSLIRDRFAGRGMAQIMSMVMAVFILVPMLAPAIGQFIIHFLPWRYCFGLLLMMAVTATFWFALRQPETLPVSRRNDLSVSSLLKAAKDVLGRRIVIGYTVALGLVFGVFVSYLGAAQQIFQDALGVGAWFPLYFGFASVAIGASSLLNSMLVMRFGMRRLTILALLNLVVTSAGFFWAFWINFNGQPPILLFMCWQMLAFASVGVLFGNLNALAMEPVGHIAGMGSAIVGFLSTLVALPFAFVIGQLFNNTVLPLVGGFSLLGLAALTTAGWTVLTTDSPEST